MEMSYNTTVRDFIIDNFLFGDPSDLTDDTDLFTKGIVDSTGVIEMVSFLETCFNITIEDHELVKENFCTIGKISGFLLSKQFSEV
jgi:acyl carrier protein